MQALRFLSLRAEGEAIPVVMLNLFQHLSFQWVNREIPKQVRNDRGEGSPEGNPSGGGLGVSPSHTYTPSPRGEGARG